MQMDFQRLVDYWAKADPDREAVFDGVERVSYGSLRDRIRRLSVALAQLNICRGDTVLIFLPNWHEFIVIFFAVAKRGAILVPCNQIVGADELRGYLDTLSPKLIFINERMRNLCANAVSAQTFVVTVRFRDRASLMLTDLYARGDMEPVQEVVADDGDVFAIVHTSGSTGRPKGAELTRANLFLAARNIGRRLKCTRSDVFFVPMPCCHLFGMVTGLLTSMIFGGKIVLQPRFDAEEALRVIAAEKITVLYGVPTMFVRMLEACHNRAFSPGSLRTGIMAGAQCEETLCRQVRAELHCDLMVAYGSTESVSVSMTRPDDTPERKCTTVGQAFEGVTVQVVDARGRAVNSGESGELIVAGFGVMKGYYGRPDETAAVLSAQGWLRTGDIAILDSDGYIKIVGRKNDMILRGGYNIYPGEVENAYQAHPDVREICVVGLPHAVLGEQICACVRQAAAAALTEADLRLYAQKVVAKYKVPDKIVFMDEIPKIQNGKFNKNLIRKICMEHGSTSAT